MILQSLKSKLDSIHFFPVPRVRKYREGYPMHKALHSSVNHSLEFVNRTSGTHARRVIEDECREDINQ